MVTIVMIPMAVIGKIDSPSERETSFLQCSPNARYRIIKIHHVGVITCEEVGTIPDSLILMDILNNETYQIALKIIARRNFQGAVYGHTHA